MGSPVSNTASGMLPTEITECCFVTAWFLFCFVSCLLGVGKESRLTGPFLSAKDKKYPSTHKESIQQRHCLLYTSPSPRD